ncbi:MAG: hypothetical protein ACI898_001878, partial [Flavobacteriales bacterium]
LKMQRSGFASIIKSSILREKMKAHCFWKKI